MNSKLKQITIIQSLSNRLHVSASAVTSPLDEKLALAIACDMAASSIKLRVAVECLLAIVELELTSVANDNTKESS